MNLEKFTIQNSSDNPVCSIRGRFFAWNESNIFLCPSEVYEPEDDRCIVLSDLISFDSLLENASVYVGGRYVYEDMAEIKCMLNPDSNIAPISQVLSLSLFRDEVIEINYA